MNRIKIARKQKGLTMKQLGDMFSVAESTVSNWENENRKPDVDILNRMAEYFHVSVDFLIGRKFEMTVPVQKWHRSLQEDYAKADEYTKIFMQYKHGGPIFSSDLSALGLAPAFTDEERALGLSDSHPIVLSDDDRELINLFAEAEEKLGKAYVQGVKQMVRIAIDTKEQP